MSTTDNPRIKTSIVPAYNTIVTTASREHPRMAVYMYTVRVRVSQYTIITMDIPDHPGMAVYMYMVYVKVFKYTIVTTEIPGAFWDGIMAVYMYMYTVYVKVSKYTI